MNIPTNMNTKERILSLAGGFSMLAMGTRDFKKTSVKTWAEFITGGILLFRGVTGYCPVNQLLGNNSLQITLNKQI